MLEEYDPTDDGKYQKLVYVEDCADTLNFSMMSTGEASTHWAWHQDLVKGGDTFFLVYTVTNRASLEALHEIHSQSFGPDKEAKSVWVLATKTDRPREDWAVPEQDGEAFSRSIGARFHIVSALNGVGLEEEFAAEVVCQVILSKNPTINDVTQSQGRSSLQRVWKKASRFLHRRTK